MYYIVSVKGSEGDYDVYLSGESEITSGGLWRGVLLKKNGTGDMVKTEKHVIIRDWVMAEIVEEKKEEL